MTTPDLFQSGSVAFNSREKASFTYSLVCMEIGQDEISSRLDDGGYDFPVICFHADKIQLVKGQTNDEELNQVLLNGVKLPDNSPFPMQFIPFDNNSSLSEVAAAVLVHIIAEISAGKPHFQVEDVLSRAIPIWNRLHIAEKRQMINATARVIDRLRRATDFRRIIIPAASQSTPHLYGISLRIPRSGGGERLVRIETLHSWAEAFMETIENQGLPPLRPIPDEGTQGAAPWATSSE